MITLAWVRMANLTIEKYRKWFDRFAGQDPQAR